ncbi:hypothetical protein ABPG75_005050 [Micractinium tetrahymenae]
MAAALAFSRVGALSALKDSGNCISGGSMPGKRALPAQAARPGRAGAVVTRAATPIPRPSSRQPTAQPATPPPAFPTAAVAAAAKAPSAAPAAADAAPAAPKSTALPGPPVQVAVCVPDCVLQFGEHLKLVGSCPELGMWEAATAASLEWQEGDNWVASLSLPPGKHACKLVLVRQDGSLHWEEGDDRALPVPLGASLVMASFHFGDTAATEVLAKQPRAPRPMAGAPPMGGAPTFAGRAMPGAPAAPAPAAAKPVAMSAAAALRAAEEKLALARR